jgi:hypothetical protein
MIDVGGEVLLDPDMGLETITVERAKDDDGEFIDGIYKITDPEVDPGRFTITASMQQADANMIRQLPEGERTSDAFMVYSTSLLRVTDKQTIGDTIVGYLGKNWKVRKVGQWGQWGYYWALITAGTQDRA